jgi:diaminohydroxyphosphoribosylaminopyrimidine deaminase/5-amino-6-(5-phosphoribosylamino)uracil reductase
VARVAFGVIDPYPLAAGGAAVLGAAGLDVESGVLHDEAARAAEAWLTYVKRERPFVTWAYVASLDGRLAASNGSGPVLLSEEALADLHGRLRRESDAVVVDAEALQTEGGTLAAAGAPTRQPLGVLVDPDAAGTGTGGLFEAPVPLIVVVAEDADAGHLEGRTEVVKVPRRGEGLDAESLLAVLHGREVCSVLLEGGPRLAGAFAAAGLVDRVIAYFTPSLIGGGGVPALAGRGAPSIDLAPRYRLDEVAVLGGVVRAVARRPDLP